MQKYGLILPDNTDEFKLELALYARDDLRNMGRPLSKWEHLRNAIKMQMKPDVFVWHRWVDDFGEAWCEGTQTCVWGAGATTKSGIVGLLCYFDLLAFPGETLTVMVTNPLEKHWDRCYSKLLLWRANMPAHLRIGKTIQSPKPMLLTRSLNDGSRRGVLCISIDKGESGADIGKKVGAHAKRTRLILEEGQALPEDTLNIATNLFMGSDDKKEIIIGNPMSWNNNAMGKASRPMSGDTALIDKQQPDRWLNQRTFGDTPGVTLVFDGLKSPALASPQEGKRLSFMIGKTDIDNALNVPGAENTIHFWSQIRGRVAPAGQVLTLYNELDWDSTPVSATHQWLNGFEQFVGMDLSLGGDKIPMYRFGVGMTPLGIVAQQLERFYVTVDITKPNRSHQIAKATVSVLKRWGIQDLRNVAPDCSGQQGAIADRIEEEAHREGISGYVYRIRTEEAVTERVLSHGRVLRSTPDEVQRETAKDRYKDRATEVLMNLVELLNNRLIWGLDDEVKQQLCTRGFDEASIDSGKVKAQKKKEWRECNQDRSPDELDAVCCFAAMVLERRKIVPGSDTRMRSDTQAGLPAWMRAGARKQVSLPKAARVALAMRRRS